MKLQLYNIGLAILFIIIFVIGLIVIDYYGTNRQILKQGTDISSKNKIAIQKDDSMSRLILKRDSLIILKDDSILKILKKIK